MTEPLDEGTRMVVQPGFRVLYDPPGTLASRLRRALGSDAETPRRSRI